MHTIIQNMTKLAESLDKYEGVITEDNLNSIIELINNEKRLLLTEDQRKIVAKSYMQM